MYNVHSIALDWGGVSREFFSILSDKCFDCSNGLFYRFKDDHQELVYYNCVTFRVCDNIFL